jgi:hypothetical protein
MEPRCCEAYSGRLWDDLRHARDGRALAMRNVRASPDAGGCPAPVPDGHLHGREVLDVSPSADSRVGDKCCFDRSFQMRADGKRMPFERYDRRLGAVTPVYFSGRAANTA